MATACNGHTVVNGTTKQPVVDVERVGRLLRDSSQPMKARFRALFILRNIAGAAAIDEISSTLTSETENSALLKHELAYCLGQIADERAVDVLIRVLDNTHENPMVRHEAGEALGAIASLRAREHLLKHTTAPVQEVAETCQLAVQRLQYCQQGGDDGAADDTSPYDSIDPAPAMSTSSVDTNRVSHLRSILVDSHESLWQRYRAMFALRNIGSVDAVVAIADALETDTSSALFRHECAYVLGQVQHAACIRQLWNKLAETTENPMVRHECAETLGAIAAEPCSYILRQYLHDKDQVVRESCEVALDMADYEHSGLFQYAAIEW